MKRLKKKRLLVSLLLGILIVMFLNLLIRVGLASDMSLPNGVAFLLYVALWAPLETLFHGGQAPIIFVAAVALFDVVIISSLIYAFLSRGEKQT